jgi:hypothetical protein
MPLSEASWIFITKRLSMSIFGTHKFTKYTKYLPSKINKLFCILKSYSGILLWNDLPTQLKILKIGIVSKRKIYEILND